MSSKPELAANGKPVESVWDYPRPPRIEWVGWRIRVVHRGAVVADSAGAFRVLETSQPPAYYIPPSGVNADLLRVGSKETFCEWKGLASYADVVVEGHPPVVAAAWVYRRPSAPFADLVDHWAFYPQMVDECWIDDEQVDANEGNFYGGWITSNVTGPFKGGPGTLHW